MAEIDNQQNKSKRDLLNERLKGKYPDKDFTDDEAFYSQVSDDYDSYDKELGEYKGREKSVSDLYARDPRSAAFMTDWAAGEDPVIGMVRRFGDDFKAALEDPEKLDALAKASKKYYERITKSQELEDEYQKNFPETVARFDKAVSDGKITDDKVDDVFEWIRQIIDDGIKGIISDETIDLAIKALNYDSAVAEAEENGEVRGRNTKIKEKLKKKEAGDGLANLDGKNGGTGGGQNERRDLGALSGYGDGLKNIWERGGETRRSLR